MAQKKIQIKSFDSSVPAKKSASFKTYVLAFLLLITPFALFAGGWFLYQNTHEAQGSFQMTLERFSGEIEMYSPADKKWITVTRAMRKDIVLGPKNRLRTGKESEIDLAIPKSGDFRLKENSEIELSTNKDSVPHITLSTGVLMGNIPKTSEFSLIKLETPEVNSNIQSGSFLVDRSAVEMTSVSVLDGRVSVGSKSAQKVRELEKYQQIVIRAKDREVPKPQAISGPQWQKLNEVRDIRTETPAEEKKAVDLRPEAGNLFNYVFDEGVFFTPNWGYAKRNFYRDQSGKVILKVDYDVFPEGSFAGIYLKTRDLDLSKVKRLSFKVYGDAEKSPPSEVRVQLKNKYFTVRGYAAKPILHEKRLHSFDFTAAKATPVSEIVFVFENTRVGPLNTNGTIYLEDLKIE